MPTPIQQNGLRRAELELKLSKIRTDLELFKQDFENSAISESDNKQKAIDMIAYKIKTSQKEAQYVINELNHLPPSL